MHTEKYQILACEIALLARNYTFKIDLWNCPYWFVFKFVKICVGKLNE